MLEVFREGVERDISNSVPVATDTRQTIASLAQLYAELCDEMHEIKAIESVQAMLAGYAPELDVPTESHTEKVQRPSMQVLTTAPLPTGTRPSLTSQQSRTPRRPTKPPPSTRSKSRSKSKVRSAPCRLLCACLISMFSPALRSPALRVHPGTDDEQCPPLSLRPIGCCPLRAAEEEWRLL